MKRGITIIFGIVFILVLAFISACGSKTTTTTTEPGEPPYASAMTDNILAAIAANDYAKFSQDFDQAMKDALPETAFQGLRSQLQDGAGDYVSKQLNDVVVQGEITTVVYLAKYTKVERVAIIISFSTEEGRNLVAGLYFQ